MSVRTNVDKIVSVSVMGQIASPGFPGLPAEPYRLDSEGQAWFSADDDNESNYGFI